jgi:hypothetical protein
MTLLALIWLGSIAAGAGTAYGLHVMRPVVSSVQAINSLTSFPVLGTVSVAFPIRRRKQMWRDTLRFSAAGAGLFVFFVLVLALNFAGARLNIHAIHSLVQL